MAAEVKVNESSCIKCGKCIRVCPAEVFAVEDGSKAVFAKRERNCISCGHCVAICPTESISHNYFPATRIHSFQREELPTPEQVMLLCKARRSNRAFSTKPISEANISKILEAAHRAPTASNRQQLSFTVVNDPEKLKLVTKYTVEKFVAIANRLENPFIKPILKRLKPELYNYVPIFRKIEREYAKGNDLILRGATAVIFISTPKANMFGVLDANLAYQNGSLMAESLNISQFYLGFVYTGIKQDKDRKLAKALGIEGEIHAAMGLATPQFLFSRYIDKKNIVITK